MTTFTCTAVVSFNETALEELDADVAEANDHGFLGRTDWNRESVMLEGFTGLVERAGISDDCRLEAISVVES